MAQMTAQDLQALLGLGANDFNARNPEGSGGGVEDLLAMLQSGQTGGMDLNTLLEMFMRKILEDPSMMARTVSGGIDPTTGLPAVDAQGRPAGIIHYSERNKPGPEQIAALTGLGQLNTRRDQTSLAREELKNRRDFDQGRLEEQRLSREGEDRQKRVEWTREDRQKEDDKKEVKRREALQMKLEATKLDLEADDLEALAEQYGVDTPQGLKAAQKADSARKTAKAYRTEAGTIDEMLRGLTADAKAPGSMLGKWVDFGEDGEGAETPAVQPGGITPAPSVQPGGIAPTGATMLQPNIFDKASQDTANLFGKQAQSAAAANAMGGAAGEALAGLEGKIQEALRNGQLDENSLMELLQFFMSGIKQEPFQARQGAS